MRKKNNQKSTAPVPLKSSDPRVVCIWHHVWNTIYKQFVCEIYGVGTLVEFKWSANHVSSGTCSKLTMQRIRHVVGADEKNIFVQRYCPAKTKMGKK